jgi:hypothetical protein
MAGLLAGLAGAVVMTAPAWAQPCQPVHVQLDPATWDTAREPFLGRAVGQSFVAPDTVITRITVWRPPNNRSVIGAHLYVTGADENGRPDVAQMLLDGPTVRVFDSTPSGQLIEMSFSLDPPLLLPMPGTYAFFLQAEACHQGAVWMIAASNANPYPGGITWITGRVAEYPCYLRSVDGGGDNSDLLFDIEFCDTHPTPVRRQTWGELKVIYR